MQREIKPGAIMYGEIKPGSIIPSTKHLAAGPGVDRSAEPGGRPAGKWDGPMGRSGSGTSRDRFGRDARGPGRL